MHGLSDQHRIVCRVLVVLVFSRRKRICVAFVYSCGSVWSVTDLTSATVSGQNSSLPAKECCVLPGLCIETVCSLLLPAFSSLYVRSNLALPSHTPTPLYTHMHFSMEKGKEFCEISLLTLQTSEDQESHHRADCWYHAESGISLMKPSSLMRMRHYPKPALFSKWCSLPGFISPVLEFIMP